MAETEEKHQSNGVVIHAEGSETVSAMRNYLEDKNQFAWPDGSTKCTFSPEVQPPLFFKWILDKKRKSATAYIAAWALDTEKLMRLKWGDDPEKVKNIVFGYTFAVKQIFDSSKIESRKKAAQEVINMKGLRHPHVVALLGTFLHQDRLNILMYPAASCDLGDLMESASENYKQITKPNSPEIVTLDNNTQLPLHKQSLEAQLAALKSYFVCLCQALSYLQSNSIRHKDIKPENVLIDSGGHVLLADFGISKRFPKNESHVTRDEKRRTARYQSPENFAGQGKGDSDDVFSLGCVFLEMASVLLGRTWQECKNHFSSTVNLDGRNEIFCSHLHKLGAWTTDLSTGHYLGISGRRREELLPVIGSLETISKMLHMKPDARPLVDGLWQSFNFPGQKLCRDCHPHHKDVWQPTNEQRQEAQSSADIRRLSMQVINEDLSGTNYNPDMRNSDLGSLSSSSEDMSFTVPLRGSPRPLHPNMLRQTPSEGTPYRTVPGDVNLHRKPSPVRALRSQSPGSRTRPGSYMSIDNTFANRWHSSPESFANESSKVSTVPEKFPEKFPIDKAKGTMAVENIGTYTHDFGEIPTIKDTLLALAHGNVVTPSTDELAQPEKPAGQTAKSVLDPMASDTFMRPPTPDVITGPQDMRRRETGWSDSMADGKESWLRNAATLMLDPAERPHTSVRALPSGDLLSDHSSNQSLGYLKMLSKSGPIGETKEQYTHLGLEDVTNRKETLGLKDESKVLLCNVDKQKFTEASFLALDGQDYRVYKMPESGDCHNIHLDDGRLLANLDFSKLGWRISLKRRFFGSFQYIFLYNFSTQL